ncbi:MAG: hypothetical protein ACF788_03995 [Novipirellula sp. JB048]
MTERFNPYQPVVPPSDATQHVDDQDVYFSVTRSQWRFAESQFLLNRYAYRLSFLSLVMIVGAVAAIVMVLAHFPSPLSFVVVLLASMGLSTCLYLAMLHHAKVRLRQRQIEHGLQRDVPCSIRLDSDRLWLSTPLGIYVWQRAGLKTYRTRKGLLVCPEPFLFVFLPKASDFQNGDYKAFRARLFGG